MKRLICVIGFCITFWSTEAQDPGRYDVVLHEIFADPTPSRGLPASEYIELRNRSSVPINLKNWSIKSGSSTGKINSSYILAPDSIIILSRSSAALSFQSFGQTLVVTSFPSLNNDGDSLLLFSASGKLIHGLLWNKKWYNNAVKEDGGWSLEMKDINFPCEMEENWSASIDDKGGTPGKPNSIKDSLTAIRPVKLLYSYIKPNNILFLQFSKSINTADLSIALTPSLGIDKIEETPPLYNSALIKLQTAADSQTVYNLLASGIKRCNSDSKSTATIKTGVLQAPGTGSIIINEILCNPPSGGYDFLEIYNKSKSVIDAQKIKIANRGTDGSISSLINISSNPFPIFPGDHFIITENPDWIKAKYLSPDSIISAKVNLPSFPDDKGTVVLLNEQGLILDELKYDEKWHFPLLANKEGVSLERLNHNAPTQHSSNWHSAAGSSGYATPGYRNSQSSLSNLTNKHFALNTKIISPDNDGRDDYVLLNYSFPEPGAVLTIRIYDWAGREINKIANNELCGITGQFRWEGISSAGKKVNRGFYVVYAEAYYKNGEVMRFKESVAVYGN